MPWSFSRKVIYPAGWCRGPVNYGEQMALDERTWQAYQTVDGKIHLRRAAADLSDWDREEEIVIPAHESTAYPDICFDKAGEPFLAFESEDEEGKGVWVRRISVIEGRRAEIIEKLANGACGPKCFRDPDNDILVFYVDQASTEIRYRVQGESWAVERVVENTQAGYKRIQNVELGKHWRNGAVKIVIAYSMGDGDISQANKLKFVAASPYPPGDGDLMHSMLSLVGVNCFPIWDIRFTGDWMQTVLALSDIELELLLPEVMEHGLDEKQVMLASICLTSAELEWLVTPIMEAGNVSEAKTLQAMLCMNDMSIEDVLIAPILWLDADKGDNLGASLALSGIDLIEV